MVLSRRGLAALTAGLALPVAVHAAAAPIRFRILREGSPIGSHRVTFTTGAQGRLTALTEVDIAVRFAGFTVFRYMHRFREVWAGVRLIEAASHLDRNGRVMEMAARSESNALVVHGPEGTQRLPAEAAPLTWWNPQHFTRPLFDNATGKLLLLQWTRTGLANGGVLWRCTGDEEGEGTYAPDGTWLSWATTGEDGSAVTYERV